MVRNRNGHDFKSNDIDFQNLFFNDFDFDLLKSTDQ